VHVSGIVVIYFFLLHPFSFILDILQPEKRKDFMAIKEWENDLIGLPKMESWLKTQFEKETIPDNLFLEHLKLGLDFRRLGLKPESIQNTYLKQQEVSQIVLFDILANRFPLVLTAQHIVEEAILSKLEGRKHICIIDIGIGRGIQMLRLLKKIDQKLQPDSAHLIGIELTQDAALFTDNLLKERASDFSFELKHSILNIAAELITADLLKEYISENCDSPIVNASLTLHHIQDNQQRKRLMDELKAIQPGLLTLIEPNAETMTDDSDERMLNASIHFDSLYKYADTLDLTNPEKNTLKTFFSNDFFDPIAYQDEYRFERLQSAETWIQTAQSAKFNVADLRPSYLSDTIADVYVERNSLGFIRFGFASTPLLSVMAFE